jgi:RNA polymerase sigma-70 factor, ECF subfamily
MQGLRSRAPAPPLLPLDLGDEADLVKRARWDRRAFAPLYRRYVAPVYGYCYHRLGSKEAAEDATSLVFAKALTALSSHRGGSFRAWLFGVTHHVVADALRTRRPDEPLDAAAVVVELLAQLPTDQRHIVELRLAGLTSAEIGQALGRSRGAVDVAYHRALVRLRTLVGGAAAAQEGHRGRD